MERFNNINKICGFYISSVHLVTMILPYINKQLELNVNFESLFEFNLNNNLENLLSKLTINDKLKQKILNINWSSSNIYKGINIDKKLKNILFNNKPVSILISGSEKYIENANEIINKFINKNTKKIPNKCINIINCYEVNQFNNNIREILDMHDAIINTSGEHKIEEVFNGYSKSV